jgi:hypothetical protein
MDPFELLNGGDAGLKRFFERVWREYSEAF